MPPVLGASALPGMPDKRPFVGVKALAPGSTNRGGDGAAAAVVVGLRRPDGDAREAELVPPINVSRSSPYSL